MSGRLVWLYLQSRRTAAAVALLATVAAVTWWSLDRGADAGLTSSLLMVMPLGAAAVISAAAGSPFGETERTASRRVPALRLGHLAGLLLCAALTLALASWAQTPDDTAKVLLRNGAGYAGLGLLAARVAGAGIAWMAPVGYGLVVFVAVSAGVAPDVWWVWPAEDSRDGSAWTSALLLLALGLPAVVLAGVRDAAGEAG